MSGSEPTLKNREAIGEIRNPTTARTDPINSDDFVRPSKKCPSRRDSPAAMDRAAVVWSADVETVMMATTAISPASNPYSSTVKNRPATIWKPVVRCVRDHHGDADDDTRSSRHQNVAVPQHSAPRSLRPFPVRSLGDAHGIAILGRRRTTGRGQDRRCRTHLRDGDRAGTPRRRPLSEDVLGQRNRAHSDPRRSRLTGNAMPAHPTC